MKFLTKLADKLSLGLDKLTNTVSNYINKFLKKNLAVLFDILKKVGLKKASIALLKLDLKMNSIDLMNANDAFMEDASIAMSDIASGDLPQHLVDYTKEEMLEEVAKMRDILDQRAKIIAKL